MKRYTRVLCAFALSWVLSACGDEPPGPEDCATTGDEDQDGDADCDDSDCQGIASCNQPEDCATTGDKDQDGAADCADSDCANEPSCAPPCGNGALDAGEQCDGQNLNGQACTSLNFDGGTLSCSAACTFDTSGCRDEDCTNNQDDDGDTLVDCIDPSCAASPACNQPSCGNGQIDGTEACDGANVGGQSCTNFGFDGGVLGCDNSCNFVLTGCSDELCNDAIDNDLDGLIDCQDPNCQSAQNCLPSCGDGVQNQANEDCDGQDVGGQSCTDFGFNAGVLGCDNTCNIDVTGCVLFCGNGALDAGEDCDGQDLGGQSCTGLGFFSGTLACDNACGFDTSGCIEFCGNGQIDNGEQCDGQNLSGQSCTNFGFDGGTLSCSATCTFSTVTCANEICNDTLDNDLDGLADCQDPNCVNVSNCQACGNGALDAGEQCDGQNLNNQSCVTQGFDGGSLACNSSCFFNTNACVNEVCNNNLDDDSDGLVDCQDPSCTGDPACDEIGECNDNLDNDGDSFPDCADPDCQNDPSCLPSCGDGAINQAGEQCEGSNLDGQSCLTLGFNAGTLACSAACTFDTSNCVNNEVCANGLDDDGDGLIDCGDPSCANDPACPSACAVATTAADPSVQTGDNFNRINVTEGSCQLAVGGGGGGEVAFQVTAARTGTLTLTLTSDADLGVYVQTTCGNSGTELGCQDVNFGAGAVETLQLSVTVGQVLFVLVDGFTAQEQGPFTLSITSGEVCDNGIDDDSDGFFDCGDNADCETNPACGNLPAGASCTADNQCDGGICLDELQDGFPTGYCTEVCSLASNLCGGDGDSRCTNVGFQNGTGLCLDGCNPQQGNANCSSGESCFQIAAGVGVCFADCTADSQCTQAGFCNADDGFCATADEVCTNGADDDGDQAVDCADLDCAAATACQVTSSCANPIIAADPSTQTGNNTTGNNLGDGSCQIAFGGGGGRDQVFRVVAAQTGVMTLTLNSAADLGVFVRSTCASATPELGCRDDFLGGSTETLQLNVTAGQVLFVFVGGFTAADNSPFTLQIATQ